MSIDEKYRKEAHAHLKKSYPTKYVITTFLIYNNVTNE